MTSTTYTRRVADDLAAALDQPAAWWLTPTGRQIARTSSHPFTVTRAVAATMLGVTPGTVAQLAQRGTLARNEDGAILVSSVLERIRRLTGDTDAERPRPMTPAEKQRAYRERKKAAAGDTGRQLAPHGTVAAHARHKRAGEDPCEPCRLAYNAHHAELDRQRRASRSKI